LNAPPDWWKHFFSGLAVSFWRAALPPEATKADVDFLWKHLGLSPGDRVLDVPCGAGRLTLPLAERGCAMTGIDISLEFLDAAREVAAEKRLNVELVEADMRAVPTHGGFDAAFCFGNSFGYLDDDGNAEFLRAVAAALKPGARFVLETPMVLENLLGHLQERPWWQVGDLRLLVVNKYDHTRQRLDIEYTFVSNGRVDVRTGSHRAYSYRELLEILESAGFTVESDPAWTRDAKTVTFIATRKADRDR
jgi:SAM-dependent methyltransferase